MKTNQFLECTEMITTKMISIKIGISMCSGHRLGLFVAWAKGSMHAVEHHSDLFS
jgi:hypothetical protein